jgi:hypothetical protein
MADDRDRDGACPDCGRYGIVGRNDDDEPIVGAFCVCPPADAAPVPDAVVTWYPGEYRKWPRASVKDVLRHGYYANKGDWNRWVRQANAYSKRQTRAQHRRG